MKINGISAPIALFMLACIFTMCTGHEDPPITKTTYSFQESPISVKMLDPFGHNYSYVDWLRVFSINGNGRDSSLSYTVKDPGYDQYIEYIPPLPQISDTVKVGDKLTTYSYVGRKDDAVRVSSEFEVVRDSLIYEGNGDMTRSLIISNSGNYICGIAIDGIANVLSVLNEKNRYRLLGRSGEIRLQVTFQSVKIMQIPSNDQFSISVKSDEQQTYLFDYDVQSATNDDGTSDVTVSVKASVNDCYEEGARLIEPRGLTVSVKSPAIRGNDDSLEIFLTWKGNCFDPKFEVVKVNDTPKEIAIMKDSSWVEYVTVKIVQKAK